MACLTPVDIEPLLLLVDLRERVYGDQEEVKRDVVLFLGAG